MRRGLMGVIAGCFCFSWYVVWAGSNAQFLCGLVYWFGDLSSCAALSVAFDASLVLGLA